MTEAAPEENRHVLLAGAAAPRRAKEADARPLARLLAASFLTDPVFDWIARPGARRAVVLEEFFFWLLRTRAIPFGEVWMSEGVVAVWIPPDTPTSPGGFVEQLRLLPLFWRLCGLPRLARGAAVGDAMEKNHPHEPHFYLAFVAVAPRLQGMGLGGAILEATIKHADENHWACYLENSNPKNTRLYERFGFKTRKNIAPNGAPPMMAMWRPAKLAAE
jgi:ribosomal protein S18 acetylase RimI-like enzyme